ncbi:MAG: hypothetical protein EOM24_04600 [Chloroflexia bacterium]|nr:hypothetical protein [Chloroflexia bacterium]
MLYLLGVLIAIGAGVVFGIMGLLTIWGGLQSLQTEIARDYVRTSASSGTRMTTLLLVGLPLIITGIFGLLAAGRLFQVGLGLN